MAADANAADVAAAAWWVRTADDPPPVLAPESAVAGFSFEFSAADRDSSGTVSRAEFRSNLYFLATARLSDALFDLRDADRDGQLQMAEWREPSGSNTSSADTAGAADARAAAARARDARAFNALLRPTLKTNPYRGSSSSGGGGANNTDTGGSSFLGDYEDSVAERRWITKGYASWVSPAAVVAAASMLFDRRMPMSPRGARGGAAGPAGWVVLQPIEFGSINSSSSDGSSRFLPMPILKYLYVHYQKDHNADLRTLMLLLLRQHHDEAAAAAEGAGSAEGLSLVDDVTLYQAHDLPLLADVAKTFPADLVLRQALLATRPRLAPVRALNGTGFSCVAFVVFWSWSWSLFGRGRRRRRRRRRRHCPRRRRAIVRALHA
jgi:hypothetical protein